MKTYMYAIHPKWCEKIFSGEKTIEVRKKAPKPPFKVVVYCTKNNEWIKGFVVNKNQYSHKFPKTMLGKVIGEFVCERVSKYSDADLSYFEFAREMHGIDKYPIENGTCSTIKQMHEYSNKGIEAIEITAPVLYDKPRELGEFRRKCKNGYKCGSCKHFNISSKISPYVLPYCDIRYIERPPQSYMEIQDPEED